MNAPLILASASPRRRELLATLGLRFEVVPSDIDEILRPGEVPEVFAQRMAREKAMEIAQRWSGRCVLAADTVVIVSGSVFGKPRDRADARSMLQALSGRPHRVVTAVALIGAAGELEEVLVESTVEFRRLEADEIERYLDSGEPFDKAGAYAVQGIGRAFVERVRGSFSNVVGLPMDEVAELLHRHLGTNVVPAP